ncbi:DUF1036 domain-containing protein [Undibacter mobilis]|uniref:DUF1036 domain-containing protein n=1 Tax=Undibacter mobilis TaxID=2292256 RepID=A0A371B704_9BRAD|nr:DUF1036 domain-containing protein [Undibacter mobilis]
MLFSLARCRVLRLAAVLVPALIVCAFATAEPARADFRLCNNTGGRVGVAIGYKDAEGWITEGWWNISARSCDTLLRGTLVARYYYIYAIDYDRGGEWSGHAFMCSREKEFTIRGTENCLARGYDRTGYFEVDTQEQRSWTVQLTDTAEQPVDRPLSPRSGPPPRTPLGGGPPPGGAPPASPDLNKEGLRR